MVFARLARRNRNADRSHPRNLLQKFSKIWRFRLLVALSSDAGRGASRRAEPRTGEPSLAEESIFLQAVEMSAAERAAYLDRACGADRELRTAVESLLRLHEKSGDLLDLPEKSAATQDARPVSEGPGAQIGPYKLLEQIGEGGFGVVFMAEQSEPVRRKVALKVLKPGMDSQQVVARFEAERQALAIMDHPNIAKVFDGGAAPSGRPFFVMELVKGADHRILRPEPPVPAATPRVIRSVCQAVAHAPEDIIHRDLKPSNVLVTVRDTTPVPEGDRLRRGQSARARTDRENLFTGFAQMIALRCTCRRSKRDKAAWTSTPRSDITPGRPPVRTVDGHDAVCQGALKQATYDEIRRIIREEEPP